MKLNFDYINNGTDKIVVFLHGWGCSKNIWNKIINKLNNVSILNIDLFGFGESDEPRDYFDTYEYSYQIFLLLKKLDIKNIVIVGHSFGGRLAILLSSIFDLSISGCVLTSSAGLNKFNLVKWVKFKWYKIVKWLVKNNFLCSNVLKKYGSADYKNTNKILRGVLTRVVNQDLTIFLKGINATTKLVWDKMDKDTPYWICKKLNKHIKSSEIVIFKTGGHFTVFYNKYKFANILFTFIDLRN